MGPDADELVAQGRAALQCGDAAAAKEAFEAARSAEPSSRVLSGLAEAAYLSHDLDGAIDLWGEAYALATQSHNPTGAARIAGILGYLNGARRGDWPVMNGWIARAQTLLAGAEDTAEAGWVEHFKGMFAGTAAEREAHFRAALDVARRLGARDLELDALAYLGSTLVYDDRIDEGMVHLDEALAGISGHEVEDFIVLTEVFCQLFSACELAHDVPRADAWIRVGETIAAKRALPDVSAFCRTHYGGLLTTAGRWAEADAALTDAVSVWTELSHRQREGAVVRLAALRTRQGRIEDAAALLAEVDAGSTEAAMVVAAVHQARGEHELAVDVLSQALPPADEPIAAAVGPLLGALVPAQLALGQLGDAATTAGRLQSCADHHRRPHLVAHAAQAAGRVATVARTEAPGPGTADPVGAARAADPVECLRMAVAGFTAARLPYEAAVARLELATVLADDRPQVAEAEARGALAAFQQLDAPTAAAEAAALLRRLGARPASPASTAEVLSKREAEVLELLGHGLTNPEIAERLYISRKTVEHHVSNVLAKLGLRNRGEAAAYAARQH